MIDVTKRAAARTALVDCAFVHLDDGDVFQASDPFSGFTQRNALAGQLAQLPARRDRGVCEETFSFDIALADNKHGNIRPEKPVGQL